LHGRESYSSTPPRGPSGANAFDAVYDQIAEVRRILSGLGLNEAQGQTLISKTEFEVRMPKTSLPSRIRSAATWTFCVELLPGLIHSLRHNVSRKNYDVALFEVGRVFTNVNDQTKEHRSVAIAITGQRALPFWSGDERRCQV